MKIVLVTGGFDPIHSGHITYFERAKELGDKLIVGINSDKWLTQKKGRAFMPWFERSKIIQNLKMVDYVISFNDDDNSSRLAIKLLRQTFPNDTIIFANGGDRTKDNIPEMNIDDPNLVFEFGVGGTNKMNSSSWILEEWKAPKTNRQWGYYRVLHEVPGVKVKELTVEPWHQLSMQRHFKRNEFWMVTEGEATVTSLDDSHRILKAQEHTFIPKENWHQLWNNTPNPLKIVEIQYGEECIEEDIERN